jgi:hypothetical protein
MRNVFRYGSAFFFAFIFGQSVAVVAEESTMLSGFSIFGGILGFFIAEMTIRKTIRVFRFFKGAILFTSIYLAVSLILIFDVFGYGSYVLPKDKVESIYLSEYSIPLEDTDAWKIKPLSYLFTGEKMDAALALQEYIAKEGKRSTREANSEYGISRQYFERGEFVRAENAKDLHVRHYF